jgi:hypothetical protein
VNIWRTTTIALIILAALLAAGCGGSADSDEAGVEDTITSYLSSIASGDGGTACEQLSGFEARSIFEEALIVLPELRATSCADALTELSGSLGGPEKDALEAAEVEQVKVDGDVATARIVGGTKTASLEKIDNRWVISGGITLSP